MCSCQTYGIIPMDSEGKSASIVVPRPSVAHSAPRDAGDVALAHREWGAVAPCPREPVEYSGRVVMLSLKWLGTSENMQIVDNSATS